MISPGPQLPRIPDRILRRVCVRVHACNTHHLLLQLWVDFPLNCKPFPEGRPRGHDLVIASGLPHGPTWACRFSEHHCAGRKTTRQCPGPDVLFRMTIKRLDDGHSVRCPFPMPAAAPSGAVGPQRTKEKGESPLRRCSVTFTEWLDGCGKDLLPRNVFHRWFSEGLSYQRSVTWVLNT